jgi:hypothetical protein
MRRLLVTAVLLAAAAPARGAILEFVCNEQAREHGWCSS